MPQSIKFYGPGGKIYDMPWNNPTPPTDKDKEDFASGRTKITTPDTIKLDLGVSDASKFTKVPFDTSPPSAFNRVKFDTNTPGLEDIEEAPEPEKPSFVGGAANKIVDMAKGIYNFGKESLHHPAGAAGVMAENAIESAKGVKRAWEDPTFDKNPGMKALDVLGQAASVPFSTLGIPVKDTAESLIKGDYGGAAVSGLASILPFTGNKAGLKLGEKPILEKSASFEGPRLPKPNLEDPGDFATPMSLLEQNLNSKQYDNIMGSSPIEHMGDFWRSVGASFDMSAPLRQGAFMLHKQGFRDSFKPMFEAAAKEGNFEKIKADIKADPMFVEARQDGLAFTDLTKKRSLREEMFASDFAEKYIPGIRASGRAYTTFLNKLRFDSYKALMESAKKAGLIDDWKDVPAEGTARYDKFMSDKKFTKRIAEYVNSATGRGNMGKYESAAEALSQGLFAPRLIASRVNMLKSPYKLGTEYASNLIKGDKLGRQQTQFLSQEYGKSLAALGAFNTVILGLGVAAGKALGEDVSVETDPTSSDFAKLRIGKTRMDFSGGVSNYIRLAAQLSTKSRKSSISGKVSKFNTGKFGSPTSLDAVTDFITSKEAPGMSYATDALRGEDFKGDKFTPMKGFLDRSYPMIGGDLYDLIQDDPRKLPLMIPAFFGAGIQTYRTNPFRAKRSPYSVPKVK